MPVGHWKLLESPHRFKISIHYHKFSSLHFTDALSAERDALVDLYYIYRPGGLYCPNYSCCLLFITWT